MKKIRINLKNVAAIVACFAVCVTLLSGCKKEGVKKEEIKEKEPPIYGEPVALTTNILENTILEDLGLPVDYIITGGSFKGSSLRVGNNATLTIMPGVTIQFASKDGGVTIEKGATIKAIGTATKRIQFIGVENVKGAWDRIYINSATDNRFDYCDFTNGGKTGNDYTGVITLHDAKVGISHCKITGGLGAGVFANTWTTPCQITAFDNNVFEGFDNFAPVIFRGVNALELVEKFDVTSNFANNGKKYIDVAPYYTKNTTINKTTVPYRLANSINNFRDHTLTINAGVTFYIPENTYFGGFSSGKTGRLIINGTANDKVKFTRLPGSNYYWCGVRLCDLNYAEINHAVFEYGGNNQGLTYMPVIMIDGETEVTLNNVEINYAYENGINLKDCGWKLLHNNVTFSNITGTNVIISPNSLPPNCNNALMKLNALP